MRIDEKTLQIRELVYGKGKEHDFKVHKKKRIGDPKVKVMADKGYQGIKKLHNNSEIPHKKRRNKVLTEDQKAHNRRLNSQRVRVEHVIANLKVFKILAYPYRNRRKRFGLRTNIIANIYNFQKQHVIP